MPKNTPKHRGILYGVMGRAHCEKCTAPVVAGLDGWILDGMCHDCRKAAQERIAGR